VFADGNTSSVRNLDVDKVGAADSLTGAVMVMVIIVVERIKRSRHEEVL
jgi:energy-converting hydrogenase Eha subunit C